MGRTTATLQTNIDNLSSSVSSILTAPSITGEASFSSSLLLSQISAPSDTDDRLYNVGGTLYFNGSTFVNSSSLFGKSWEINSSGFLAPTTTLKLLLNQATSTLFSANQAWFGGTATTTITNTGFVGVATSSPFAQLSVNSEAGLTPFVIGSSTATSFIVDKNGNVGVGTSMPVSKLDIHGTSTAHSFAFSGNSNTWELRGRGADVATWGVPYFRSTITNSPTSLDVMPNGTGGGQVTGKAWIDICNSDLSPTNSNDFSCLLLAAGSDSLRVGTHHGGNGTALPLSIWGSSIGFALDQFTNDSVGIDSTGLRIYDNTGANQFWWFYSGGTRIKDTHVLGWSGSDIGSPDTGLARNTTGILEVNNGTKGTLAGLTLGTLTTIGNVGIGSTTPSKTLAVDGELQVGTPQIVVSGTMAPDYTGTYTYIGVYNYHKYYQLSGVGYVWWNTSGWWEISASLGVATNDFYSFDTSRGIYPPFGSWTGRNGASGTLKTSAGTDSHLAVDSSGNITTGGILTVNGIGNNSLVGNVGIGTTSPWTKLGVNGTVAMPALSSDSTGYYACVNTSTGQLSTSTDPCGASSEQYKENIRDIGYGLDEVMMLRPVMFQYKESYIKDRREKLGFIAEDVDLILPEVVTRDMDNDIQGLDYPKFTSVLVKAVQEIWLKISPMLAWFQGDTFQVQGNICVDDTCMTKEQFKEMMLRSGVGATQTVGGSATSPVVGEVESEAPGEVLGEDEENEVSEKATSISEVIEEVATSTDEIIDTTKEIIEESEEESGIEKENED